MPPEKPVKKPVTRVAKKPAKQPVKKPDAPILSFATSLKFAHWLQAQPADSSGVWLRLGKKTGALKTLSYPEALDVALAWGWIDGQLKSHDEDSWLRKFTPRRSTSIWSKINREKALALIAAGKMQPPGLAEVERAKQDGRWQAAYDSAKNAAIPPDFSAALKKAPRAASFFETLDGANRYAVLFRVQPLRYKKPETRTRKIAELVAMLERGEKIHGERRR
ncbi:MAG: YdeI/OmpD-associated family protein [Pseudomonadota bacterium]